MIISHDSGIINRSKKACMRLKQFPSHHPRPADQKVFRCIWSFHLITTSPSPSPSSLTRGWATTVLYHPSKPWAMSMSWFVFGITVRPSAGLAWLRGLRLNDWHCDVFLLVHRTREHPNDETDRQTNSFVKLFEGMEMIDRFTINSHYSEQTKVKEVAENWALARGATETRRLSGFAPFMEQSGERPLDCFFKQTSSWKQQPPHSEYLDISQLDFGAGGAAAGRGLIPSNEERDQHGHRPSDDEDVLTSLIHQIYRFSTTFPILQGKSLSNLPTACFRGPFRIFQATLSAMHFAARPEASFLLSDSFFSWIWRLLLGRSRSRLVSHSSFLQTSEERNQFFWLLQFLKCTSNEVQRFWSLPRRILLWTVCNGCFSFWSEISISASLRRFHSPKISAYCWVNERIWVVWFDS